MTHRDEQHARPLLLLHDLARSGSLSSWHWDSFIRYLCWVSETSIH